MKRILLIALGLLFVGIAGIGVVLPGLPATPFLLIAAWCFTRSSPRLERWLRERSVFSPILKNWQETRTIPRRAKITAFVMVLIAGVVAATTIAHTVLKATVLVSLVFPIFFISRLKETESLPASSNPSETASSSR